MIRLLDKPPGWTPLEALDALRARDAALRDAPMVYAGRLDPMAEGLLLVLTDADRFDLPAHLGHDKGYDATFLFGVASDSFDALGRLRQGGAPSVEACAGAVGALAGMHRLPLPAWSAYRVRGRPLHAWAREGRIAEVELPVRAMEVASVSVDAAEPVRAAALLDDVLGRIARVRGAFRQAEAAADWASLAAADPLLLRVRAALSVSAGTYVRALAEATGGQLGCGGLLLALRRTRIGPWRVAEEPALHRRAPFN